MNRTSILKMTAAISAVSFFAAAQAAPGDSAADDLNAMQLMQLRSGEAATAPAAIAEDAASLDGDREIIGEGDAEYADDAADTAADAVEDAADATADAAEDAVDAAGDMAEDAGEAMDDAVDATGEAIDDAADATGEALDDAADAVEDAVDDPTN